MTRADFDKLNDVVVESITLPVWGEVFVRSMSLKDQIAWEKSFSRKSGKGDVVIEAENDEVMCRHLTYTFCDKDGNLLFQPDEWERLSGRNTKIVKKLYEFSCKVSGIGKAGQEQAAKNSDSPAGDSD